MKKEQMRLDLPCFLSFSSAFSNNLSAFSSFISASSKLFTVPNLLISSVEIPTSQLVLLASCLIHSFRFFEQSSSLSVSKAGIKRLSINSILSFKLISRGPDMIFDLRWLLMRN